MLGLYAFSDATGQGQVTLTLQDSAISGTTNDPEGHGLAHDLHEDLRKILWGNLRIYFGQRP